MVEAYPLQWPQGWERSKFTQRSRFDDHSLAYTRDILMDELRRLGATQVVISTNIALRRDGLPYSGRRQPDDKGVAVYFQLQGESQCMPCDKWSRIECNIWAIAKCIEALRGLERWGAKNMVRASFQGFKALPEHASQPKVDYFQGCDTRETVKNRFNNLSKQYHPDTGGDQDKFIDMMKAYELKVQDLKSRGLW